MTILMLAYEIDASLATQSWNVFADSQSRSNWAGCGRSSGHLGHQPTASQRSAATQTPQQRADVAGRE
jgi:hypothetical protein